MIPAEIRQEVETHLGTLIRRVEPLGGGCIAHAHRVDTDGETYFLKWGTGEVAQTFPAEAHGLVLLQEARALKVPDVIAVRGPDAAHRSGWLLLEWIPPGRPGADFWERFGSGLAELHRMQAERYGLDRDNFIGMTPQRNRWKDTWPAFFRDERLLPQMALARRKGYWEARWDPLADRLLERLETWLPERPEASLVHGDLWSGNYLVSAAGEPVLIDPAVYFGHREVDLAMSELFGGFPSEFYEAYAVAWPLEQGYRERRDIYNLYHLLNHLNLFGASYASSVARMLQRYGG